MNGRKRHYRFFLGAFWALAVLLPASAPRATQVRPVNLEEMTQRAATVFSGRCIASRLELDPTLGRPVTVAVFEVDRLVKGSAGETITVKILSASATGDVVGGSPVGIPRFREGEEVVLFLYGESSLGLTSPVGLGQGKFSVVRDKQGREVAVNEFGNKNLLRRLSQQATVRLGAAVQELRPREGIEPDTLLDLAQTLNGND